MFATPLVDEARRLLAAYRRVGLSIATAESCTGGLIAALLTEIPSSSEVLERGFVTYSNAAKSESLGVAGALLAEHGAVSGPVAGAMAEGALARSRAEIAISVTGLAGPGGGSATKPVGLVIFGLARRDGLCRTERRIFDGDRSAVRQAALQVALGLLAAEARS